MTPFLLTFLIAFALSFLLTPLARRLGGIPFFVAFTVGVLASRGLGVPSFDPQEPIRIAGLLIGGTFVFVYGLIDDRYNLRPVWHVAAQIVASLIAIASLIIIERFNNPLTNELVKLKLWQYVPLTLFWMMGMINTVNWLDGLDGLAAGIAAIFSAVLFVAMIRTTPEQPRSEERRVGKEWRSRWS